MQNRRKNMRADLYDYRQDGRYFVTIVTNQRVQCLGSIANGVPELTPAGSLVEKYWSEIENKYRQVEIEDFVIMPNHLRGIIRIHPKDELNFHEESLGDMIKWFKSLTTNAYIRGVNEKGWPRFEGKFWQSGYYDHIIRNDADLLRVQEYIASNPAMWEQDPDNRSSDVAW